MMLKKEWLDVLLVERGLVEMWEKVKRVIMVGIVYLNENCLDKFGEKIDCDFLLIVKGNLLKYVSRGGLKFEKVLKEFFVFVKDKIMIDIGFFIGGFMDCVL